MHYKHLSRYTVYIINYYMFKPFLYLTLVLCTLPLAFFLYKYIPYLTLDYLETHPYLINGNNTHFNERL